MTKDNKQRFNTYRKEITRNEEDDFNEEESSISNESSLSKEESRENLRDNETDEKDVSKQQNVNEESTNIKIKLEFIELTRNRKKFMINIIDIFIITNVITLKIVYSNSFKRKMTKTRIFILQVDNKITNVVKTFEERKIRYVMFLLREVTTK